MKYQMKRSSQLLMLCVAVLIAMSGSVQAGTITTLFNSNNGGQFGGGVYFDINVLNSSGITVEKLFANTEDSFNDGKLDVYIRSGTAAGFEGSAAGWTLVSTGLGDSAGLDNPSEFDVTDFFLGTGVTGIAIGSEAGVWGHNYTDGNGSNQAYSNSDLTLTFGTANNSLFSSGSLFDPRVWNGTIEYSIGAPEVPEPSSLAIFCMGACFMGCAGRRRRR